MSAVDYITHRANITQHHFIHKIIYSGANPDALVDLSESLERNVILNVVQKITFE